MSIADEISRLKSAKSELKSAIEEKGIEVPDGTKLDGYPSLVQSIQENVQPDWEQNNPVEKDYMKGELTWQFYLVSLTRGLCPLREETCRAQSI